MAVLFSKEFGIAEKDIIRIGVFDALLDEDSHFFINIKRLQSTDVPEFIGAYEKINNFFRGIGLLLKNSTPGSKLYREAEKKFCFPEVNGINLGFSNGTHGAGFGKQLRKQIIHDAYEIIQSGSEQPEIFQLTSLFEENVGPDRLSGYMLNLVLHRRIIRHISLKRVYPKIHINTICYYCYLWIYCTNYRLLGAGMI